MLRVPMNDNLRSALEEGRKEFIAKFGREPGPDDPILFDPDLGVPTAMSPERLTQLMVGAFQAAGIDPALIHAFKVTGLILTEENAHLISNKDKKRWRRAIQDFERGAVK